MNHVLLVAMREFRQIAGTRSFWLTLLLLPFALAVGPLAQHLMHTDNAERVMLIDRTGGGEARAIAARLSLEQDRSMLVALSRYVQRYKLERADPQAPWAHHDQWYGDAAIVQFRAAGGLPAARRRLASTAPPGTPTFDAPKQDITLVDVPPSIAATPLARLDDVLQPLLHPAHGDGPVLDYALLLPADFAQTGAARLWSNGQPEQVFVGLLQDVLTRDLRQHFLVQQGLSAASAEAADRITPSISVTSPPPGGGLHEAMLVRSLLPLAAAYLLMMSLMLSGSWMLQGTIEERSNKLLETVLACVSPEELMYGKLLGTVSVGLSMIVVWIGCGLVAAYATHGAIADLVRPALAPLTSPGVIAAMIYFFVVGYVAIAMFFLAIGAMSDSMRDAQGYLTPLLLVIILPITILIQSVLGGGGSGSIGIEIITWVPIWTPFAVLARLGAGIPAWEVIGTAITLGSFTALELVMLGRLFRASLLAAGQRPSLATIAVRLRKA